MKDPLKKYIQDHRDKFDNLEVPDEMLDKIMSKMDNSMPSVEKTRSLFPLKTWAIAASVAIILSLGIFNLWREKEIDKTVVVAKHLPKKQVENPVKIANNQKAAKTSTIENKIAENEPKILVSNNFDPPKPTQKKQNSIPNYDIKDDNHSHKANAIELMNNEFSASARLQGIALVKSFSDYDSKIIDFLSEKAISDENTNVRLAAIYALEMQKQNPAVAEKIQHIFIQQNDPMVQKELISYLAENQSSELNPEVNSKLLALAKDPSTMAFVKDEAYAVIMNY